MDRNTVIGILLIIAILIGFAVYNAPSDEEIAKEKHYRDSVLLAKKEKAVNDSIFAAKKSIEVSNNNSAPVVADSTLKGLAPEKKQAVLDSIQNVENADKFGPFAKHGTGTDKIFTIENDVFELALSSKGGKIKNVKLKNFKNYHSKDTLEMFISELSGYGIPLSIKNRVLRTDSLYFEAVALTPGSNISENHLKVTGESSVKLGMRINAGQADKYFEFAYTVTGNSYMIDFDIHLVNLNNVIDNGGMMDFEWYSATPRQEKDAKKERENSTVYYRDATGDVSKLGFGSSEKEDIDYNLKWIGFSQQFFTATLIAEKEFDHPVTLKTDYGDDTNPIVRNYIAEIRLPIEGTPTESFNMQMYLGPKDYKILKKFDLDMEEQISLGWKIFRWVNTYFIINVFQFLDSFNMGYGLIILILTLLVKIILSPITYKTYVSSAKMRILKPDIDALNEKNKDADPMKKQQEVMALYKRAGVSPFAGCIPGLIQMPILFAIFNFFPSSIELRQQAFLWADDLSSWDSILQLPFTIPFYGDHVSLFTLLMTVTTMIYTSMTTTNMGSGAQAKQMKIMMYVMPILFLGVLNSNSAALCYYYFLANTISILQTIIIRKFIINEAKLHAQIEDNKKRPVTAAKKSKWQQRLDDMQKLQRQRAEELSKKKKK